MRTLTEKQLNDASRLLALILSEKCTRQGIPRDEVVGVVSAAVVELLAQHLGPIGTVERLRDLADVLERQCLDFPTGTC